MHSLIIFGALVSLVAKVNGALYDQPYHYPPVGVNPNDIRHNIQEGVTGAFADKLGYGAYGPHVRPHHYPHNPNLFYPEDEFEFERHHPHRPFGYQEYHTVHDGLNHGLNHGINHGLNHGYHNGHYGANHHYGHVPFEKAFHEEIPIDFVGSPRHYRHHAKYPHTGTGTAAATASASAGPGAASASASSSADGVHKSEHAHFPGVVETHDPFGHEFISTGYHPQHNHYNGYHNYNRHGTYCTSPNCVHGQKPLRKHKSKLFNHVWHRRKNQYPVYYK